MPRNISYVCFKKKKTQSTAESNLIFAVLCFSEEGQAINTATKKTGKNVNVKKKCWCTLRLLSETGDRLKCSLLILGSVSWSNSMIPSNLINSVNCVPLTMGYSRHCKQDRTSFQKFPFLNKVSFSHRPFNIRYC